MWKKYNIFYKQNNIILLVFLIIIYLLLKHYIPYWNYIVYPVNLLVTFMHEFGHAFFALITGWDVKWLVVNSNWSGLTTTSWGIRSFIIMWWYIWSAIFGNILLYIWFKKEKISQNIMYFLSGLIFLVSIIWFSSIISTIILIILSWILFLVSYKTAFSNLILQFLGVSSIIFILEDFNVWPSSDLENFSTFLPSSFWMIIWLLIVICMTWYNLYLIFRK